MTAQVRGREVVLQGGTRTVDDQGHVTTEGGKASPNPLLPVIDRAHRSLQVALEELLRPAPWAVQPAAPDADGRHPEPEHPWLRHPDETAKAYAARSSSTPLRSPGGTPAPIHNPPGPRHPPVPAAAAASGRVSR